MDAVAAIEAVWRIESAQVVATVARMVRDLALAEELAQDALVAALEHWPASGVPANPGAWLVTTAKRRALDHLRHRRRAEAKHAQLAGEADAAHAPDLDAQLDDDLGDDVLRLVFTACHPVLAPEARVALTLRLVAGLTTAEIARAFLVPEPTIAQRIVRAKRALAEANVPYEVPRGEELAARLGSVLEVIYLVFNEGYAASSGAAWLRTELIEDALRLARIVAARMPRDPEAHGLVALLELQASRAAARVGPDGAPILLLDQNRARWDHLLIRRGLAALATAEALGAPGPYALQAAIAACHARAPTADATDWPRIAALYAALVQRVPSPVIELNRAVAIGMAFGPAAALEIVDALTGAPALARYHLLPSVRADLLVKLGRHDEARRELHKAIGLCQNERERELLAQRAAALA